MFQGEKENGYTTELRAPALPARLHMPWGPVVARNSMGAIDKSFNVGGELYKRWDFRLKRGVLMKIQV